MLLQMVQISMVQGDSKNITHKNVIESYKGPANVTFFAGLKVQCVRSASTWLEANLHKSRKIVNCSNTFLSRDFPDSCCDCCLQFNNLLKVAMVHIILEIHYR